MEKVYFVGMDQHKKTSTMHVRGSDGSSMRTMTLYPASAAESLETVEGRAS